MERIGHPPDQHDHTDPVLLSAGHRLVRRQAGLPLEFSGKGRVAEGLRQRLLQTILWRRGSRSNPRCWRSGQPYLGQEQQGDNP